MKFTKKLILALFTALLAFALLGGCEGPAGPQGERGEQGLPGDNATPPTVEINSDGFWVINGTVSPVKAEGVTPTVTIVDGNWVINGTPTGVKAQGDPGTTPTVAIVDGNWVINGTPTGVKAEGVTPTVTIVDGIWVINGTPTGLKAEGPQGGQGPAGPQGPAGGGGSSTNPWRSDSPLWPGASAPATGNPYNIDIYTFNDFHGTVDKTASGSNPGADRFVAIVQELSSKNPYSVTLAAGDIYQGSPLSNVFYGEPVSEMLKMLGVAYSSLGNHEFDWGVEYINKFAKDGNITFLAANIFLQGTNNRPGWVLPYGYIYAAGKKIGLIGLTTVDVPTLVKAEYVAGLEFRAPGQWTTDMITDLKTNHGCDFVFALTHMGASTSANSVATLTPISGEAYNLATTCPTFDAIIAGHVHAWAAGTVNNVPIVASGYNGRGLGRLTIAFDASGNLTGITPYVYVQNDMNNSTPILNSAIVHPGMKAIINRYNIAVGPLFAEVVGTYGVAITSRDEQAVWANKVVHDYIERETGDKYILFQNAGGWRDTSPYNRQPTDDVTVGYLYTLMPFDNEIVLLEMQGKDILYMLGLSTTSTPALGSAAVVTGAYNDGGTWKLANGTAIANNATVYKVACNDFMVTGGDAFPFPGSPQGNTANVTVVSPHSFMGVPLRDAMIIELKHRAGITAVKETFVNFLAMVFRPFKAV